MGGNATPSPTPPVAEAVHSSSSSIMSGIPGAMPSHAVGTVQNPWHYSTPPGEEQFVDYATYPHPSQPNPYPQWDNNTLGGDVWGPLNSPCSQYLEPPVNMNQVYLPIRSAAKRSLRIPEGSKPNRDTGRIIKRTRAKKTKTRKAAPQSNQKKKKSTVQIPHIDLPLSAKAKEPAYSSETIDDIETYVERDVKIRQEEAHWNGRVKRELNPFLLYRKRFKNVAAKIIREQFKEDSRINPRISSLCGHSWNNLEPPEVKNTFEEWSKTEKKMLKEAFPGYFYQPKPKPRASEVKEEGEQEGEKEGGEDEEDEESGFMTGPPGMTALRGDVRRRERSITSFSQDSLSQPDNNLWPSSYESPHVASGYGYGYQLQPYARVGSPDGASFPGSPSPGPFLTSYSPSIHDVHNQGTDPTIDPKLYFPAPPQSGLVDDSFGVMGHATFSREASEGPVGQAWASSIPGNGFDLHGTSMNELVDMDLFTQGSL